MPNNFYVLEFALVLDSYEVKDYFISQDEELNKVKSLFKNPTNILQTVQNLHEENHKMKKEIEQLLKDKAASLKDDLIKKVEDINGVNFLSTEINLDGQTIKNMAFELGNKIDNLFFINGANINGKPLLTIYISRNLSKEKELNAGSIVRELSKFIQGGGGGQPFFATAGGKNPEGLKDALKKAKEMIQK